MKLTKVIRLVMKPLNGSNNIRYSAMVDGEQWATYETDGVFRKHLSKRQFKQMVLESED